MKKYTKKKKVEEDWQDDEEEDQETLDSSFEDEEESEEWTEEEVDGMIDTEEYKKKGVKAEFRPKKVTGGLAPEGKDKAKPVSKYGDWKKQKQFQKKPKEDIPSFKAYYKEHQRRQPLGKHLGKEFIVEEMTIKETDRTDRDGNRLDMLELHCKDGYIYFTFSNTLIEQAQDYVNMDGPFPCKITAIKEKQYYTFV